MKIRNICCIGAGYVGGPTMAVFAHKCKDLIINVVDIDNERIKSWNDPDLKKLPIYEPGLDKIVSDCRNKNLFFTTDIENSIANADIVFLSVNSPTKVKGIGAGQASDLKWIEASARQVANFAKGHTIVVEKSTLPVRTAELVKKILQNSNHLDFDNEEGKSFSVLSNPEFLSEGSAINDLLYPDRILIGGEDQLAVDTLFSIYKNWVEPNKIITTNLWSSELSKLAANAFLAQRISSVNSIAALCEKTGANIHEVTRAIGMDKRIGKRFISPGPGFGGSCFKKDILNLVYLSNFYGLKEVSDYWISVVKMNDWTRSRISKIIVEKLFGTLSNKKIAILGFSFKANTNDTRESSAINICKNLIEEGAKLAIYDPKVEFGQIKKELTTSDDNPESFNIEDKDSFTSVESIYDATNGADAVVIITEWNEFKNIDWQIVSKNMRKPSWLFDTRNISNYEDAMNFGINVWLLGIDI